MDSNHAIVPVEGVVTGQSPDWIERLKEEIADAIKPENLGMAYIDEKVAEHQQTMRASIAAGELEYEDNELAIASIGALRRGALIHKAQVFARDRFLVQRAREHREAQQSS